MAAATSSAMSLTAEGASDSWENNKSNQVRLGNEFLKHISTTDSALGKKWGTDWARVPEQHRCSTEIYEHIAYFFVHVYKKSTGKPLELGGVITAWGGLISQASQEFKQSTRQETKVCSALAWRARSPGALLRAPIPRHARALRPPSVRA